MKPLRIPAPVVDYRKLRPHNIFRGEFAHLKYLLFWPIFGLLFWFAERFYTPATWHVIYSPLDSMIPFCELFVIPYIFWFAFIVGMLAYTLFYDTDAFKRYMMYIIITYSVTIVIYFLYPSCQELRPLVFERDNIFTRFMAGFYQFDTNTNVCPSIHVIGSLAVLSTALSIDRFKAPTWRAAFVVTAVLICISTVFLKQHSVIDLIAALPLCMSAHIICFGKRARAAVASLT